MISPREIVSAGQPVATKPSCSSQSCRDCMSAWRMTTVFSGSKTTMSASDPTAIVPFLG